MTRAGAGRGRRGLALGLLAGLGGCAHVEAPPGGPPDTLAPAVIAVRPENLSVHPEFEGSVRFQFDERISEREIDRSVLVAPAPGGIKVEKERDAVKAEPRRGWEPGRIYHATLLPVVQDLFGNRIRETVRLVFSTGPAIPENVVTGAVMDPLTGRGVPDARVLARWLAEDVAYVAVTDSVGDFRFEHIPEGEYAWLAFEDRDRNLSPGPFEPADSTRRSVRAADTLSLRFRIVLPDSTPPVLDSAIVVDSLTVAADFDEALDPEVPADSIAASLRRLPDGESWPIERVVHAAEHEAGVAARDTAARDTAARDTGAPRAPQATTRAPGRPPGGRGARARVILRLGRALRPGDYELAISGARNLVGLAGGGTVTFSVPEPAPEPEAAPEEPPAPEPPP